MYVVYLSVVKADDDDLMVNRDPIFNITIIKDGKIDVCKNTNTKEEAFLIMSREIPRTLPVNYECFTSNEFNQHN